MNICNVLQITPEQLLTGKGIEDYHGLKEEQQKRLVAYMEALKKIESLEKRFERALML